MRTIKKYFIDRDGITTIHIQNHAKLLSIQMQGEEICAWFELEDTNEQKKREFVVFDTGQRIPDEYFLVHQGTIQYTDGLVGHVYSIEGKYIP